MLIALIIVAFLLVTGIALQVRSSRPDGTHIGKLHPYRRLMFFIMPTRTESAVYYDEYALAEQLERYLQVTRQRFHADMTHCLVGAIAHGFKQCPSMNRFVIGRRLYERKGIWLTFSMKRKKLNRAAKIAMVKREIAPADSFYSLCSSLRDMISVERSEVSTHADKEYGLFVRVPRAGLNFAAKVFRLADYFGLLPGSFIRDDGMYCSAVLANLGSLGMQAAFHHLYEWGTCPLFIMAGRVEERVMIKDGVPVARRVIPLRFTYDERIDDGLSAGHGIQAMIDALENPFEILGCVNPDGTDDHPIGLKLSEQSSSPPPAIQRSHQVVAPISSE